MERSIKRNLELASDKSKYDTNAKNLLSEKDILAYILQTVVHEFKEYKIEDIIPRIEYQPPHSRDFSRELGGFYDCFFILHIV